MIKIWDRRDRRPCLVVMRSSDEYDWPTTGNIECTSGADLSEKSVNDISPDE